MINQIFSFISRARLAIALGALSSLLLIAAGCGSSGDGESSAAAASSATTKAVFVKQADGICEQTDKTQKALLKAYFVKHPNASASTAVKEDVVTLSLPPILKEAEEIGALSTPEGDEAEVKAYVAAVEHAVEEGEANPAEMVNEKPNGPFSEAKKLGGEYGFEACEFPL